MKKKTVLVVDDNDLNLKLVKQLLTINNYHVLEACDAETGIDIAKAERPQLILMDIQLPGINGLEATQILKNDPEMCTIPVVALTSFAMSGDKEKVFKAGCDGYITKPINTREFTASLEEFF